MLKDILPPKYRKLAYVVLGVAVAVTTAGQVGFLAAGAAIPVALKVALAVEAYLGGVLGFTAAANTPSETPQN